MDFFEKISKKTTFALNTKLSTLHSQLIIMANRDPFLPFPMQVHCAAETVLEHLAVGALACLHPRTVTEELETIFPHIEEVVLINVALHEAAVDVRTSGDGAIDEDGADGNARAAEIEPVADLALVGTNISLTTEFCIYLSFLSGRDDKVHQLAELFSIELQVGIIGSATDGLDAEKTPCLHLMLNEQLLHGLQLAEIHRADASDNVVSRQPFLIGKKVNGAKGVVETALAFSESIVRVAQTVEADGDAAHARIHQLFVHGLIVSPTIADNAPRESVLPQLSSAVGQVGTHQRLAACNDNQHRVAFEFGFKRFDGIQEILEWHVLVARRGQTVRAAVLAIEIASLRAFPKEVVQLVELSLFLTKIVMEGLEH